MTIGATWPHRSGGIGVKDIFVPPVTYARGTLGHLPCSSYAVAITSA
jgi:hypothetical protein